MELPRPTAAYAELAGHVRIGYARASTVRQSLDTQFDSLKAVGVTRIFDEAMLSMALHLRDRGGSLRDIAAQLVITKGKKKGRHPSPATVLRMLRDHDEAAAALAQPVS